MASSSYYLSSTLYRYLLGKDSANLPKVILNDPLVRYVRGEILNNECPFCWRKYMNKGHLAYHLQGKSVCAKLFNEFVELTVDRYMLFYNSTEFRRKLRKLQVIQ